MYQAIGLTRLLTAFAVIAGGVALIRAGLVPPPHWWGWWTPISMGLAVSSAVFFVVGQTPLFPWLCRLWWVRDYAPDISGSWRVALDSNWPTIAQLVQKNPGDGKPITGEIKVTARLFKVKITFKADSAYSNSKTVSVNLVRDEDNGDVRLYYVYENATPNPLPTDTSHHYGAAYVDIVGSGSSMVVSGLYWTNRNWTRGENTAGTVKWNRI